MWEWVKFYKRLKSLEKRSRLSQLLEGRFYFKHFELELCFLTADLVQVDWKLGLALIPYAIDRQNWSDVETSLQKVKDAIDLCMVSSSALRILIDAGGRYGPGTDSMVIQQI